MLYIWDTQFLTVFIFTGDFVDNTDNIIKFDSQFYKSVY